MVVVLNLAVTIFTDTASTVDHERDSPPRSHFFCCGSVSFSLLRLGHIVSIVGLLPALLKHFLAFINLLNFVV